MEKTLRNIRRVGDATTQYPFEPLEHPYGFRGKPEHDEKQCMACGACAVACPPNAIQMAVDEDAGTMTWSFNAGRCVFCGRCEEVCPTRAIKLGDMFEMAVMNKNDLEETSTYSLMKCSECGEYFTTTKHHNYVVSILKKTSGVPASDFVLDKIKKCDECRAKESAYAAKAEDENNVHERSKMEAKA